MKINSVKNQPNFNGGVALTQLKNGQFVSRVFKTSEGTDVLLKELAKDYSIPLDPFSKVVLDVEKSKQFVKKLGETLKENFDDILNQTESKRVVTGLDTSEIMHYNGGNDLYVDLVPFKAEVKNFEKYI